ncbi:MAG: hypothetical protein HRU78_13915 [Gammaproteobacteria bacterium]|nr:MAG: hypothetical protein HRU78_13915 [Gammaproteobacteria bacterium]
MKRWIVVVTVSFMAACANLHDTTGKTQRFEEKLAGEHAALAACVTAKLQSDGRSFLRPLQFKNRQYPDIHASEIHAYDTRYLRNAIATYAPSNPDAILIYGNPAVEVQSATQRSDNDKPVYAFALLLQQIDSTMVNASLRGDPFFGNIAWKVLRTCVSSPAELKETLIN